MAGNCADAVEIRRSITAVPRRRVEQRDRPGEPRWKLQSSIWTGKRKARLTMLAQRLEKAIIVDAVDGRRVE